jgi:hypothetical protein
VKTSFGGSLLKQVCSKSSLSSTPWLALKVLAFLGRVCRTQVPSRAAFLTWSTALEKTFTLDNLRKCHVIVINRCCRHKKTEESVDHFLIHCDVASALWNTLFSRFRMS